MKTARLSRHYLWPCLLLAEPAQATAPAPEQSARPINRATGEHYAWGGINDGWHLVKQPGLSVIEERIAPGASEVRHYHRQARQFFYVLSGELTMEAGGFTMVLKSGQGIEIAPGKPHQAQNRGTTPVEILVNSTPPSHGDRIESALL